MNNSRIVLLTNIPSPYRVLQFDEVSKTLGSDFTVIYYRSKVHYRKWTMPDIIHQHLFLNSYSTKRRNISFQLFLLLKRINPQILITTGFTTNTIISYVFCRLMKRKFIILTDSWLHSVNHLGEFRRMIRRFLIPKADASICVGIKGKEYLIKYGAKIETIFTAPLAIDNQYYSKYIKPIEEKKYDIIFSGQFIDRKMPYFVIDVINEISLIRPKLKLLLIGSGPLKEKVLETLNISDIDYTYPGFIQQTDLPKYYSSAKVLLFPTKDDPWGLVANEACAAGTPVITCDNAGVANELVQHNYNGYVLPLETNIWVQHLEMLLSNKELYNKFASNSMLRIQEYSISSASAGILSAVKEVFETRYEKE